MILSNQFRCHHPYTSVIIDFLSWEPVIALYCILGFFVAVGSLIQASLYFDPQQYWDDGILVTVPKTYLECICAYFWMIFLTSALLAGIYFLIKAFNYEVKKNRQYCKNVYCNKGRKK
jgi:hypothetical protein